VTPDDVDSAVASIEEFGFLAQQLGLEQPHWEKIVSLGPAAEPRVVHTPPSCKDANTHFLEDEPLIAGETEMLDVHPCFLRDGRA